MPITYLWYAFMFIVMMVLIVNVVYPLWVPKYKLFFMFRKDRYIEAEKLLAEAKREVDIEKLKEESRQIKSNTRL